jgi:hypothetical protein
MLGLFKAKRSISEFAEVNAWIVFKILAEPNNPDIDVMIRPYIAEGANPQYVRFEVAAMSAFSFWVACSKGLATLKFSPGTFNKLVFTFRTKLDDFIRIFPNDDLQQACRANYKVSASDFFQQRFETYTSIVKDNPQSQVVNALIAAFCGSVFHGTTSEKGRQVLQYNYLSGVDAVYQEICKFRLVKD